MLPAEVLSCGGDAEIVVLLSYDVKSDEFWSCGERPRP